MGDVTKWAIVKHIDRSRAKNASTTVTVDSRQLVHAFVGNSQIYRPEVLWLTRCTFARGHIGRHEIVLLLPNTCKNM